ncbi:protein of unknown function [Streptomyces murinus]
MQRLLADHLQSTRGCARSTFNSLSVALGRWATVSPLGSAVTCGTGIVHNARRPWPG